MSLELADAVEKVRWTVDINSVLKWNSLFRETGRPEGTIIFKWPLQRNDILLRLGARPPRQANNDFFDSIGPSRKSGDVRFFAAVGG
jgi:hypothetical protein